MIKISFLNAIFSLIIIKMKHSIQVLSLKQVGLTLITFLICCLGLNSILANIGHNGHNHESIIISRHERELLKEEARDMFYHAYRAYMENAYPADELMPLSCHGRWRDTEPNRGDIDDSLGNFSLTLIDTLDTLVILGDFEEFDHAVRLIVQDVTFDSDVVVSVFETNIRVLGGLLSAHILAEYVQLETDHLQWYKGELLSMAKDLGFRLLPAFNTSTGIPHARINLKYGLKSQRLESSRETCTACAGTMILELAALSRLTGEAVFEQKGHRAMDELWRMRHRSSDLMGTVLNIHSGDWVRRDSGVGAGIDSYYEYCLKAYILLGDEKYLSRFNKHYSAVMKYISQGPLLLDVHMHRPHTNSRNFMDALLAFWPGLQVLKGDLRPAVETHEMLYQIIQRHNFIPEAFTTDFQVHWGQHPLRPEFLESTYFLYRATNDPYYLEVGRTVLRSLQKYARVPCGYAAVQDVRTGLQEDRMDSFVLAETFKYLFLLFADPSELPLDLDQFLFTTEAHLLPLSLARQYNYSTVKLGGETFPNDSDDFEFSHTCPNTLHLFPASVRRPLRNMVAGVCPRRQQPRRLHATEFQAGNPDHLRLVKDMGISILTLPDGRVQLLHTFASAKTPTDADEGLLFMQEMVELAKSQVLPDSPPQAVYFTAQSGQKVIIQAGPAHFGKQLTGPDEKVTGQLAVADPARVCDKLTNLDKLRDRIVIMERGDCMFVDKARRISQAGAIAGIVMDNTPGTSANNSPMFAMSGDGNDNVEIPVVFLFYREAMQLLSAIEREPALEITITELSAIHKGNRASLREINESKSKLSQRQKMNQEATLEKLRDPFKDFLIKQDIPKDSKKGKEINQVEVGEFHASVEASPSGLEMIRISRRRGGGSSSVKESRSSNSAHKGDEEESLEDEQVHTQPSDLGHVKDIWIKELAALASDKRSAVIPAPVLKLYHQMMNKNKETSSKTAWTGDDSIQLQIAWLLGELVKANGPVAPQGTVTSAKSIEELLNERMNSITDNTNSQLAGENDQLISIKRKSLDHQDQTTTTSDYKTDDKTTSDSTTITSLLSSKDEL